jgi:hypothetical protein
MGRRIVDGWVDGRKDGWMGGWKDNRSMER